MSDCKCTFTQKTVGDGCDVCNPALALQYARETMAEQEQQIKELSESLTWTAQRLRDSLARRPIRDATECLAMADRLTGYVSSEDTGQ